MPRALKETGQFKKDSSLRGKMRWRNAYPSIDAMPVASTPTAASTATRS